MHVNQKHFNGNLINYTSSRWDEIPLNIHNNKKSRLKINKSME